MALQENCFSRHILLTDQKLLSDCLYFLKYCSICVLQLFVNVACVVDIKLLFFDWFCYNLIILIKLRTVPYKNLDKALLFSRNQVFCLKIWKLWRAPTTLQFNIFIWNFTHVSYLPMTTKGCAGFSLFCLDLEFFAKIKKTWFLHTRVLHF